MARTDPQVNFRMPAELKEKLQQAADQNNRTLSQEVVIRLEQTFRQTSPMSQDEKLDEILRILTTSQFEQ